MNFKKATKVGIILAASAALVATLVCDKKDKEDNTQDMLEEVEN